MTHDAPSVPAAELNADEAALLKDMPTLDGVRQTRRTFLGQGVAGGLGWFATELLAQEAALAQLPPTPGAASADPVAQNVVNVVFRVNGAQHTLALDSRMVLLDALRERLSLTPA